MDPQKKSKHTIQKIGRIALKTILYVFLLFLLLVALILTPPVQDFIRGKAVSFLQNKLHTTITIGKIYIGLPKKVVVEDVYIEDQSKDTLFAAGSLKADIDLIKLISGAVVINSVEFNNITAKVKREMPDTVFNFQFIINAFTSTDPTPVKEDTTSTPFSIHTIELNNIRVVFKDTISGNDAELGLEHFYTNMNVFDMEKMRFEVAPTQLRGLTAKIYQRKPLVEPEPSAQDKADAPEPIQLQLKMGTIDLRQIQLDYRNDVSALYAQLHLGTLHVEPKELDLNQRNIILNAVSLDSTSAAIRFGKKTGIAVVKKEAGQETESQAEAGWRIWVPDLQLNDNALQFDDDNAPRQKTGIDYMHLKTDALTFHVNDFRFNSDSIAGAITKATFKEQSGFALHELRTTFLYAGKQAYLKDLYVKTPGTEIKRDIAIQYESIAAIQKNIGALRLDADIANSKIQVRDILSFVPSLASQPVFADPNATLYINGRVKGTVADLQIPVFQISGLRDTKLEVSGSLTGLPDVNKMSAHLTIKNISTSKRDMDLLIPTGTIPQNITVPNQMQLSGKLNGDMGNLSADLLLKTTLGNIAVKGTMQQMAEPQKSVYDMQLQSQSLDLGTILQNRENLGPVTADVIIKGKGYDIKTAAASLDGKIQSAMLKQYEYRDLNISGSIAGQQAKVHADIADPNIHFAADAMADLSTAYPSIQLNATIDSIKMQPLHFTEDMMMYRGKIEGDFQNSNPDSLDGKLFILQSLLVHNQQRLQMDSIQLLAGTNDTARYIQLNTDILNAKLWGKYKLTDLGNVFSQAIQPYFSIADADSLKNPEPYDFNIQANIINGPALPFFVPGIKRLDSVVLKSRFSNTDGWNVSLAAPAVVIGADHIHNLQLNAGNTDSAIVINADVNEMAFGENIALHATSLKASVADNTIHYTLNIKDKTEQEKYNLAGIWQQVNKGEYLFSLNPENLLLNYKKWEASADNKIVVSKTGVNAQHFIINQGEEQLSINSASGQADAPMDIKFSNFRIATLTGFVQPDSTLADGILHGEITVSNITTQPGFVGDLTIDNLSIKKDTVGNIKLLVDNKTANTYNADVTITGNGNDVHLGGQYFSTTKNFDLALNIRSLPLTTVQALSAGAIRDASGALKGSFTIKGTIDQPSVNGDLIFDKTVFNPSMLNNVFAIDQERLSINDQGIAFNNFSIKDSANNELTLDGMAGTTNFLNYDLDLKLVADNFRALNSTKKDNNLFYGQLYFNTNLTVKGTELAPVVDGRLKINDKTKMTIVLPQSKPGVASREGIVVFVDKDAPENDSLFLASYDSLNTSSLQGMEISVNIEVDKAAGFTLVVDEGSGDFLNIKGGAQLTAGVEPNGRVSLAGSYEIEEGSYDLTFNFLHRKFDLVKGSTIIWGGEPTDAELDITAKYTANAAPLDLVKNQLGEASDAQRNTYLQKIPFDVTLRMTGKLLKPQISFDILLPEDKNYTVSNDVLSNTRTKLEILRQDEAEMNKQAFSLLLLNRFMTENPFESSGTTSTSTMVKQSVSKLMAQQLNQLAADLIKGVELNFDIESSDDYTSGQQESRTDLNVGLSKKLLHDRLTVTIGSNFALEGPKSTDQQTGNIAGNIALNYQLTPDGRYMLQAYRKNEYEVVFEGYIIETGVGFVITADYNKFKEIFRKRKTPEQRAREKEQKRIQRESTKTTE